MSLEVKAVMNICTKDWFKGLDNRPKLKQWMWFVSLWFFGLIAVATLTYPLKLLMKTL